MTTVKEVRLKSRPVGLPTRENFDVVTANLRDPGPGEVQVKNLWMSVDPYMRGRMNDAKSYSPAFPMGATLDGAAIGAITASNDPKFREGDLVQSNLGWREGFTAPSASVDRLATGDLPPQAYLGVAGLPGLTAYVGLLRIAALKTSDVVFVSGAAGAVGSVVCQIATAKGHRVIGSAGGPEKVAFLRSIGVDHAIDYKAEKDLQSAVLAGAPDGIDVFFDNVGGSHLDAALDAARLFARFAICGMISAYNATAPSPGPSNLRQLIGKNIRLEGYVVTHHTDLMPTFTEEMSGWVREGKVKGRETVFEGIDKAPDAFLGLFSGKNTGKMLVKLA